MKLWPWLLLLAACTAADAESPELARKARCMSYLDVQPNMLGVDSAATGELRGDEWSACATLDNDSLITWVSRNTAVFTIASTSDTTSTVTGVGPGTAYAVGTVGTHSDSSLVTVGGGVPPAIPCVGADVSLSPGDSVADTVAAYPAGTSFCLAAGTYRFQSLAPKTGDKIIGSGLTTILSGGRVLTGWTSDGSGHFYKGGQTQQNTDYTARTCEAGHPGCSLPEQLWSGSTLREHMTTLAAVASGTWYFDYAADRIYVSDTSGVIETSVTPAAFTGSGTGVAITHLLVQHYATGSGHGTIGYTQSSGWHIDSVEVGYNNGSCVRITGTATKVRWSRVHHCGLSGINGPGSTNSLVYADTIDHNNTALFGSGGGDAAFGGLKMSHTTGLIVRKNYAHHNHGTGLWEDIDNIGSLFDSNRVTHNDQRGIDVEISYDCEIAYNVVDTNAAELSGMSAAGIWIPQSSGCEIHHNTLVGNVNAIVATDRFRGDGAYGPYVIEDLSVHHNTIYQTDNGFAGGLEDSHPTHDPYAAGANNVWANNTYHRTLGTTRWRWSPNANVSETVWRAAQDAGSSFGP